MDADLQFLTFGATVAEPETAYLGDLFPGGVAPEAEVAMWSQVSGPALVGFDDPTNPLSNATFDEPGRYVLRIDMADGPIAFGDSVTVEVINQPPVVDAGEDTSMVVGETKTFEAFAADDRIPHFNLQTRWTTVAAPTSVEFDDSAIVDATVVLSELGLYVFRLEASDGMITSQDFVSVLVEGSVTEPVQVTEVFQVVADTHVSQNSPSSNFGEASILEMDATPGYAGLIEFNLSEVPEGADVLAASIALDVINPSPDDYEIYALQGDWGEFDVTWETTPSHNPNPLGELFAPAIGRINAALNDAALAQIEEWIDDSAINYGFIIQDFHASNGLDFRSKEDEADLMAFLILTYEWIP